MTSYLKIPGMNYLNMVDLKAIIFLYQNLTYLIFVSIFPLKLEIFDLLMKKSDLLFYMEIYFIADKK